MCLGLRRFDEVSWSPEILGKVFLSALPSSLLYYCFIPRPPLTVLFPSSLIPIYFRWEKAKKAREEKEREEKEKAQAAAKAKASKDEASLGDSLWGASVEKEEEVRQQLLLCR